MRELLILRHGITETNERRAFTGSLDVPLSEKGRQALLERKPLYPPASAFFTSGMLRAVQTLELLYGPVPRTDIPALAEYRFGDFQGRTHQELFDSEPLYREWLKPGVKDVVCPGGESLAMFQARVDKGFEALLARPWENRAVLVAHGGVIRRIMWRITDNDELGVSQNGCGWMLRFNLNGKITGYEAFE